MSKLPEHFLPMSEMMLAFLQQIKATPAEDTPRLIFADWLEEQGDPRGPLMRLQCQIAALDERDPGRIRLRDREPALLLPMEQWFQRKPKWIIRWEMYRGLAKLEVRLERGVAGCWQQLSEREWWPWCDSVTVRGLAPGGIAALAGSPHLSNLASLNLSDNGLGDEDARVLESSPHLSHLTSLNLSGNAIMQGGAQALSNSPYLHHLTSLNLSRNPIGVEGAQAVAGSTNLSSLASLQLDARQLSGTSLQALTNHTAISLFQGDVTDHVLSVLGEKNQLHVLSLAKGVGNKRPSEDSEVTSLNLANTRITDEGLRELKKLHNLEELNLARTGVTDAGLKELREFNNLCKLSLSRTRITDAGLTERIDLTELNLLGTRVTDEGLKELGQLTNLTMLHLADTQVTDAGLKHLNNLHALASLFLTWTRVTEKGLEYLKGLRSLVCLDLHKTLVTDKVLKVLRENDQLHALSFATAFDGKRPAQASEVIALDLADTPVTDEGLRELEDLVNLTELTLSGNIVTDRALEILGANGQLHALSRARGFHDRRPTAASEVIALNLSDTPVTDEGLKQLKAFQNLSVVYLSNVTDRVLGVLRANNQLHVLAQATARDDARPAEASEITSLSLSSTSVTEEGLRELKDLTNLATLDLPQNQVTDRVLAVLRENNQLHTLSTARGANGERPADASMVTSLDLSRTCVSEEGLKELKDLRGLVSLVLLRFFRVTDRGLKILRENGQLHTLELATAPGGARPTGASEVTSLDLTGAQVTSAGLKELQNLTNLSELRLKWNVAEEDLKELKGVKSLASLDLQVKHAVTDGVLAVLQENNQLHVLSLAAASDGSRPADVHEVASLDLARTRVTDEGLKELKVFTNLTFLDLSDTKATDAGLKELKALPSLTSLGLSRTQVTDAGVQALTEMIYLTELWLIGTRVTDTSLKELQVLTNLTSLRLYDTEVTDEGMSELQRALPKLKIQR